MTESQVPNTHTVVVVQPDRRIMFLLQLKYRLPLEFKGIRFKGKSAKQYSKSEGFYKGNLTEKNLALALLNIERAIEDRHNELRNTVL